MATGTTVVYNEIAIVGCTTKRFSQAPVYDDTGTDLLYYLYRIRVSGYVHGLDVSAEAGQPGVIVPSGAVGSFPNGAVPTHIKIRAALMEPHHAFQMRMDSLVLLEAGGQTPGGSPVTDLANFDVNNGPKPQELDIVHVTGSHIFKIEYEIEIALLSCGDGDAVDENNSGVLSNRWSVTDDIDENLMTTRTVQGRLRVADPNVNPHSFRQWVMPKLQTGFRREHMTFVASADSLNLDYTIIDREVAFSAPSPATDWDFQHTEETGDGMIGFADASVRLSAPRNANKQNLIQLGMQILHAKLHIAEQQGNSAFFIETLRITDSYGSRIPNTIQVSARVRHLDDNRRVPGVFNLARMLGRPINGADIANYEFNVSAAHVDKSEGPLPLVAALSTYLQSPCDGSHDRRGAIEPTKKIAPSGEEIYPIEAYQLDGSLPEEGADYSTPAHKAAVYTYYQADNEYEMPECKVQVPIAMSEGSALGSDSSVVISLGRPVARRILRVKAERVGLWPALPAAQDYTDANGIRHTLLRVTPMPGVRDRTPDGREFYRAEAEYVYALSRRPTASETMRIGVLPWDAGSGSAHDAPGNLLSASETQPGGAFT